MLLVLHTYNYAGYLIFKTVIINKSLFRMTMKKNIPKWIFETRWRVITKMVENWLLVFKLVKVVQLTQKCTLPLSQILLVGGLRIFKQSLPLNPNEVSPIGNILNTDMYIFFKLNVIGIKQISKDYIAMELYMLTKYYCGLGWGIWNVYMVPSRNT